MIWLSYVLTALAGLLIGRAIGLRQAKRVMAAFREARLRGHLSDAERLEIKRAGA